jgi:hypothetical protein
MLPEVHGMFALVRDLASGREVTEIPVDRWYVLRHNLGPLAARAGAPGLRGEVIRCTVEWARVQRDLPPIVRLLECSTRVAALKGVAYATGLYDAPADRPMTDIDLFVEDRSAWRVLADQGFEKGAGSPFHHATTWTKGTTIIDLHHDFVSSGRGRVDLAGVWRRVVSGALALRLDPVDELAFHLIHMARTRMCGPLIQIIDLHRLGQRCDPDEALARCDAWQLGRGARRAFAYYRSILAGDPDLHFAKLDDVLECRQPSIPRRIAFELATSESPRQLAARALDAVVQRALSR